MLFLTLTALLMSSSRADAVILSAKRCVKPLSTIVAFCTSAVDTDDCEDLNGDSLIAIQNKANDYLQTTGLDNGLFVLKPRYPPTCEFLYRHSSYDKPIDLGTSYYVVKTGGIPSFSDLSVKILPITSHSGKPHEYRIVTDDLNGAATTDESVSYLSLLFSYKQSATKRATSAVEFFNPRHREDQSEITSDDVDSGYDAYPAPEESSASKIQPFSWIWHN